MICSSPVLFQQEISKLRTMFSANGYPIIFFNQVFDKYMARKNNPLPTISQTKPTLPYRIVLKLPYVGRPSSDLQKELAKLVLDKFGITVSAVYVATKVGSFFSLKAGVPSALASNVIYKYTCSLDANVSYIGKTIRHLTTRAQEHTSAVGEKTTAVCDHISICDSCQTSVRADVMANFTIVRRCNKYDIDFHEALLIKKSKPILNIQLFRSGANTVLKIFG